MSTASVTPVVPAEILPPAAPAIPGGGPTPPVKPHGFMSFLKTAGRDTLKVFKWLASPANQNVILAGETLGATLATTAAPELAPLIAAGLAIAQKYTKAIFTAEALGAQASAVDPNATNAQKAALAIAAISPEVLQLCAEKGLVINLAEANDAMVAFWNALGQAGVLPTAPTAPAA